MAESKKKTMLIIAAAIVVVFFVSFATVKAIKSKDDTGIPVKTAEVIKQDIESNIFTSGTVVSKETREVTCDLSGKIKEVIVEEGEEVKEGQIIAKIDSSELEYEVKQAEINLEITKARLDKLKKEDRNSLEVSFKNAEIQYRDAVKDYEDKSILLESGAISKSELQSAKSLMDKAFNEYKLAKDNYENADQESEIQIQEKEVKAAELRLEKYRSDLEKTNIFSPINGTITNVNISELSIVGPSTILFIVQDTKDLEVVTNISEYDINQVKVGQEVKVTGEGVEDKVYKGIIKYISPNAVTTNNGQSTETIVEVKIGIEDENTQFKPNFSANVDINTAKRKDALVVPYEAIYSTKDGEKIIFTVEDGIAKENVVKTGIDGDILVEVISDEIKEGQIIILSPNENIKDGIAVIVDSGVQE